MERWRGRSALVTGASAGIGYAVAKDLAEHGLTVFACARNIAKLEELAKTVAGGKGNGKIYPVKCDLTKEPEILQLFKTIEEKTKHVDILVNNAGFASPDDLLTGRTEKWREMLDLNVLGLSICAREALRLMDKNKINDGHIINVNSMGGHAIFANFPSSHWYGSTKHMVTALSKALNAELRAKKTKIRVTNLSPGSVETEFASTMIGGAANNEIPADMAAVASALQIQNLTAKDISNGVLYVLGAPAHVAIHELIIAPTEQPCM